jgi:hypothetical protein
MSGMEQPGPGTGVDMETEAVAAYGTALADTGTRLEDDYTRYGADITAGIAGIGRGEVLSDSFRPTHDPDSVWVRQLAGQLPAQFARLSTAATVSAAQYVEADRAGAAAMPR